jgi:3-phosphoshikimate 1-carboxyvinyltransferase
VTRTLCGELTLPGDKSISHRALMMLGLSQGQARIQNLSQGQDVLSTLGCMQALGCTIEKHGEGEYQIAGVSRLVVPTEPLDCGNSGTTIRLLGGILAGAGIAAVLTGDESLQKRPMKRIMEPLVQMGASIQSVNQNGCAPLQIQPSSGLHGITYALPMASAQVKSAILLAGLMLPREEKVVVVEPLPSRDHTERMLTALGAEVKKVGDEIQLLGRHTDLKAQDILVPGDISSAAFWLVGAAILPGSKVTIRQVGLNPTRTGILDVLQQAGVQITISNQAETAGEPYGDITVEGGALQGNINLTPELVPSIIDEIPILTVLGLFTDGVFILRGAEELKYKESDRLASMIGILRQLGIEVDVYDDGFRFQGNSQWLVPPVESPFETFHDHRLVMALAILNLRAKKPLTIIGQEWASVSYPTFFETLERLLSN